MNVRSSTGGSSPGSSSPSHQSLIEDQFSRQANLFAKSPELHSDAQIALLVDTAQPQPGDCALDVACGPGTVAAVFAELVHRAVGVDATGAMLDQARALAAKRGLTNVEWQSADVYRLPFADGSFDIVSCRFAFHHFERPVDAFTEMVRVCRSGGRVVVCDGIASADPVKGAAFNEMEKHRDPSTAEFRTLAYLSRLFATMGLPQPKIVTFQVVYERESLIAKSFPANDDRVLLGRMVDSLIASDAMDVGTVPGGSRFIYPAVVLAATKS